MKTMLVSFLLGLSSSAPTPVSLGHALQPARVTAGDGFFVYVVDEAGDGGQDWNGDGDSKDKVAHVYDLEAGCEKNLRIPVHSQFPDPAGDLFLFGVRETSQGHTDLNGDGDTSDIVVHVYEHGRGTVTNLGLAVDSTEDLDVVPGVAYFEVNESESTSESGQGADLTGTATRAIAWGSSTRRGPAA